MYKIPEGFNKDSIKNNTISQIAFGLNFITLFFSNGFIQFSGGFSILFDNQKKEYEEVYPVKKDYDILMLLEKKIIDVKINNERNVLTLEFEGAIILELIGSKEYESYILNICGKEIVV